MPYVQQLQSLTPREAIADALWRLVIGMDRNDVAMFNSALFEDITFDVRDGERRMFMDGLSDIHTQLFKLVGPMDTTHMISNLRIDVRDGADTASLTCYALAQHCPRGRGKEPDGPKYTGGGEYWVDLAKDNKDGLWKIKKWVLDHIWSQGDRSVMQMPT